jgi:hypothetical protein
LLTFEYDYLNGSPIVFARFLSPILSLMILLVALGLPARADGKRVALVIGNAAYKHAAELRNPRNDAQDVAEALEKLGFTVISEFDLDRTGMGRAIGRFGVAIENATVAVFYFAGHGMQLHGTNYFVPTDSKLENHYSPELELMSVATVQRLMESKPRTNIIFLDACRDNPLARNLARSMGTRSTGVLPGLSRIESGNGTLISFSTQPGAVALDGTGRNSPFAEALVRQLSQSSLSIADMLIDVRRDVKIATKDRQITWEHSSLSERFYFTPPKPVVVVPSPPPAAKREEEQAALARQLNRELKRVGCDSGVSDSSWKEGSQTALQRFAEITKLALHTDEPSKAALDAVTSHKFIVCPRLPVATPPPPEKPAETPVIISAPSPPIVDPAALAPVTPLVPRIEEAPARTEKPAKAAPLPPVPNEKPAPESVAAAPTAPPASPAQSATPPSADVPPPATAKSPKTEPRTAPRSAAVKSLPPPATAPATPAAPAPTPPFATSVQSENACRIETLDECLKRIGHENTSHRLTLCPVAARKEICPGSRPAASRPTPARTVERENKGIEPGKKCRRETVEECYRRNWSFGAQNMSACPTDRVVCQ